jgi:hypothetical protein
MIWIVKGCSDRCQISNVFEQTRLSYFSNLSLACPKAGHGSAVSIPQKKWFYYPIPQNIYSAKNPYKIELKTTSLVAIQS